MSAGTLFPSDRIGLSYREAAELLGLSSRTIWGLVAAGELKCFRVGRAVRISRSELERYVERRIAAEVM